MILIAILQYLEAKIVYAPFIIFNHWGHTIIHKNVKLFWPELKMWYQVFSIFRMYCEPKAPSWIQRAPQHFTEAKRKGRQASWSSSNHYITVQCYTALYWHWHTPWGHSYSTGCSLNQMGGNTIVRNFTVLQLAGAGFEGPICVLICVRSAWENLVTENTQTIKEFENWGHSTPLWIVGVSGPILIRLYNHQIFISYLLSYPQLGEN